GVDDPRSQPQTDVIAGGFAPAGTGDAQGRRLLAEVAQRVDAVADPSRRVERVHRLVAHGAAFEIRALSTGAFVQFRIDRVGPPQGDTIARAEHQLEGLVQSQVAAALRMEAMKVDLAVSRKPTDGDAFQVMKSGAVGSVRDSDKGSEAVGVRWVIEARPL